MNNLHRELAPISDAAWADIEEETTRTLKRHLAELSKLDSDQIVENRYQKFRSMGAFVESPPAAE